MCRIGISYELQIQVNDWEIFVGQGLLGSLYCLVEVVIGVQVEWQQRWQGCAMRHRPNLAPIPNPCKLSH